MNRLLSDMTMLFFVALGVVVGGALCAAVAAVLTAQLPMSTMRNIAERLKLWAAVAALGGSFYTLQSLETGLREGQLNTVSRQLLYIVAAFAGAQVGLVIVYRLVGEP